MPRSEETEGLSRPPHLKRRVTGDVDHRESIRRTAFRGNAQLAEGSHAGWATWRLALGVAMRSPTGLTAAARNKRPSGQIGMMIRPAPNASDRPRANANSAWRHKDSNQRGLLAGDSISAFPWNRHWWNRFGPTKPCRRFPCLAWESSKRPGTRSSRTAESASMRSRVAG